MTPARAHFVRLSAQRQAGGSAADRRPSNDQYEIHAAALWEARRALKNIKALALKIEKKRELLPQFTPYVEGVLASGSGAEDDVLMTVMVWRIDTGDIAGALDIADYAVTHALSTPDRYARDTISLVVEEISDSLLERLAKDDNDTTTLVEQLERTDRLAAGRDMHDQIRAKLCKALGYAYRQSGQLQEALEQLEQALTLNARCGVKKDIERLTRELNKAR